jgi:hypothetical protein
VKSRVPVLSPLLGSDAQGELLTMLHPGQEYSLSDLARRVGVSLGQVAGCSERAVVIDRCFSERCVFLRGTLAMDRSWVRFCLPGRRCSAPGGAVGAGDEVEDVRAGGVGILEVLCLA